MDIICTKLQENASKISKVPRGHAFRPHRGHTCDERTASLSPTPHAPPPFQNPGSAPAGCPYNALEIQRIQVLKKLFQLKEIQDLTAKFRSNF